MINNQVNKSVVKTGDIAKAFILFCFFLVSLTAAGQKLSFRKDGKFKIVQFTDLHWKPSVPESEEAIVCMNQVLNIEKPDLVIYTGDHITESPVIKGLEVIFEPVISRKLPFAVTLGNHDDECDMTRRAIFDYMAKLPGNLTGTVEGLSGVTNFAVPLYQADGKKLASIIYGLDTNHDAFVFDQVAWFVQKSREYTRQNEGTPLPSLAFFHIPIPEYQDAIMNPDARFYGTRKERICYQSVNAGMFSAFLETGDIMAVVVGHDHLNDFVVCWKNIMLCYGRVTGGRKTTHYNHPDGTNGARVIELTEGQRRFESWIRLRTGEKIKAFKYPFDFIDK